jgi:hypothetical protein
MPHYPRGPPLSITPRQEAISPNITRPRVVSMFLSIVPFLYSKRTAAARSLVSLIEKRTFCGPLRGRTSRGTPPYD